VEIGGGRCRYDALSIVTIYAGAARNRTAVDASLGELNARS